MTILPTLIQKNLLLACKTFCGKLVKYNSHCIHNSHTTVLTKYLAKITTLQCTAKVICAHVATKYSLCTYTVYIKNAVKMYVHMHGGMHALFSVHVFHQIEHFSRITFCFILRVGVTSPPLTLRSTGRMRKFQSTVKTPGLL